MALYPPKKGAKYRFNGNLYKVLDTTTDDVILELLTSDGAVIKVPSVSKKTWENRDYIEDGQKADSTDDKNSKYNDFKFSFDPESGDIIVTYPDGIKEQRLQSIRGPEGKSVFDDWCQKKGIQHPTAQDWEDFIQSLKGKDGYTIKGVDAPTPFEEWRSRQPKNASEDDLSYDTFIKSITGPKGKDGYEGKDGKSAYDVWKETQPEGKRSIQEFLNYLSGKPGKDGESAYETWLRLYPHNGQVTEEDFFRWLANLAASQASQGDTYLPSIDVDGKLYFTNSRTGERSQIGHNVLGKDGKTYTPHVHNDYLWFEDENGNRPFPPIHIKGDKGDKGERGKSAFELWREDPLHPENTGKTLDDYLQSLKGADGRVVNTYHNELAELEDYTCPIQEINPYMIVSTDTLKGSESAEKAIELEKAKINGLRAEGEKYANHGSWIQEFFWWCAGADRPLLRMCPGEHSKYMGIGTVIFFTALMAWFSSFVALGLVTGESANPKSTIAIIAPVAILIIGSILAFVGYKRYKLKRLRDHLNDTTENVRINSSIKRFDYKIIWILGIILTLYIILYCVWGNGISAYISWAAVFACAWSLMIFFLDRFITNTMYSDGKVTISWLELRSALPRIVIAIFLGIVISAPLELNIFKQEVDDKLFDRFRDEVATKLENDITSSEEVKLLVANLQSAQGKCTSDSLKYDTIRGNDRNVDLFWTLKQNKNGESNSKSMDLNGNNVTNESATYRIDTVFDNKGYNDALKRDSVAFNNSSLKRDSLLKELSTLRASVKNGLITDSIYNPSYLVRHAGLYDRLQVLHSLAFDEDDKNNGYKPWDTSVVASNPYNPWYWFVGILLILFLVTCRFYKNVVKKDGTWWKGAFVIVPWLIVISSILAYCNNTIFHALPYYIFSAVGMIMMLFILIDVSPVFYKMMLADGVYDKLLHKEKLLTEDAIRLNAAKSFAKVNDSTIGRLAPFVFGKTSEKLMEMLKDFKLKSAKIDLDNDGRPKMGYGQSQKRKDIDKTNTEVFSYVLDLKKRLVKAAYLAWYRDMRDHVLATKEDDQTPPTQPEEEFPEFDDSRAATISVELDCQDLAMLVDASEMLTASVRPLNESTPEIRWQSRDEKVAIVENGVITAIAPGVTEIIATCGDGFAMCKVTVSLSSDKYDTEDVFDDDAVGSSEAESSESSEGEDIGDNIKDEDEDDEHEVKEDETFRDINK